MGRQGNESSTSKMMLGNQDEVVLTARGGKASGSLVAPHCDILEKDGAGRVKPEAPHQRTEDEAENLQKNRHCQHDQREAAKPPPGWG